MKRRNIIFYKNAYYNFYYLSKALRKRGWDAITVSIDDPESDVYKLYHGEDINLFSSDPQIFQSNIEEFYEEAILRYDMVYFQGDHCLSFFPKFYGELIAPDLLEWKRLGKKIGHISSGCLSGIAKNSIKEWSALDNGKVCCDRCVYPESVCSNKKNLRWGRQYSTICDIVSGIYLPALDYMASDNIFHDPIDVVIDKDLWSPNLEIPEEFKIDKNENEILIFHAMGNYNKRTKNKVNIKGTNAIFNAVEKLKLEGLNCRLIFVTDLPNIDVRFIQAQADIVVEQLNVGRCGATSREGMMLGKPVITYLNRAEPILNDEHPSMKEMPIISAGEENIYDVLKDLIQNQNKLIELGEKSRSYALKWLSAEACAERFEKAYDIVMQKGRYNNGIYGLHQEALKHKKNDSIDYYINLAENNQFTDDKKIDSITSLDFFKKNWEEYLEYAWLYNKIPYYISMRLKNGNCKFGENFENALIELELGGNGSGKDLLISALDYFEERSEKYLRISKSEYLHLIAQVELKLGNIEQAINRGNEALAIDQDNLNILIMLGEICHFSQLFKEAKFYFERAYYIEPDSNLNCSNLSNVNIQLNLPEYHINNISELVDKSLVEISEYIQQEKLLIAEKKIDKLLILVPDQITVLVIAALIKMDLAHYSKAKQICEKILRIDPENVRAKQYLIQITKSTGY